MPKKPLEQTKILVIGSSGQVGSAFRKQLTEHANVWYSDRNTPKKANTIQLDLTNQNAIEQTIKHLCPGVIINCAAYTAVDAAETHYDQAAAINGDAVKTLASSAQKSGSVLIHYSTDYVFDGSGSHARLEEDDTAPINAYGRSKLIGEEAVRDYNGGYIMRTQWVYAQTGRNFVNSMLRLGQEREEIAVVCDQVGAPTPADLIAEYTLLALDKIIQGQIAPGIYHLVCNGATSWYDFAEHIFASARARSYDGKLKNLRKILSEEFPTPAARPKNSRLSVEKFEKALSENLPNWLEAFERYYLARWGQ